MANSIGIIDSDYYGNESNDGHFYFQYFNFMDHDIEVKKGDVIGQVIFQKFLTVDNDNAEGIRTGGFGSTDKKWCFNKLSFFLLFAIIDKNVIILSKEKLSYENN